MRIAIDHSAGFSQGAGIGRYARNIVPAMAAELANAQITLWYAPDGAARFASEAMTPFTGDPRVRLTSTRIARRRMDQLWFRARAPLPIELWTGRQDLIYSPDFTAPPAMRTPRIVTVHDLAFQIAPQWAPSGLRAYLSAVVPRAVRSAAAVIAVSETTKRDLIDRLGVDPARITVAPNAADARFFAAAPLTDRVRTTLGLPERYLLTVGTLEPRKNHLNLFKALDALPEKERLPLVVVGRVGWSSDEIVAAAKDRQVRGQVMLLDYLPDEHLPGLYAGAAALVYPSWYEGFGLPIVEGLAAGTPIVASSAPAHREVGGDVVAYCVPSEPESIAEAICAALALERDAAVIAARRAQAARYSWERSGRTVASVINEVVAL